MPQGAEAASKAATWVAERQTANGALFSAEQTADATAEAVAALVAGDGPRDAIDRALGYLAERGASRATRGAYAARIVMGVVAAGRDPRDFGGTDYVARLRSFYNPATGAYDDQNVYANALATLGAVSAGETPSPQTIAWFRANQCASGGFSQALGCANTPDVDTTSLALTVLVRGGVEPTDPARTRARGYLVAARNPAGGYGQFAQGDTNVNSTALALTAIAALGEDPTAGPWSRDDTDPLRALLALQDPSGGFRYAAGKPKPDEYGTVQAIIGAAGKAYPVPAGTAGRRARDERSRGSRSPAGTAPIPPGSPAAQAGGRSPGPPAAGATPGAVAGTTRTRAAIVVLDHDEELRRLCLDLDEPAPTGYDLLRRTGFELAIQPTAIGAAVCGIGDRGCSASGSCFCDFPVFWRYWTLDPGGSWTFSERGAQARTVRDGSVDVWTWTDSTDPPPSVSFEEVCAAGAASAPASAGGGSGATVWFAVAAGVIAAGGAVLAWRRRRDA